MLNICRRSMQNENEKRMLKKSDDAHSLYQSTHSFFASASGFDILLKMNNIMFSTTKVGCHDNDGAQTEAAVMMTS